MTRHHSFFSHRRREVIESVVVKILYKNIRKIFFLTKDTFFTIQANLQLYYLCGGKAMDEFVEKRVCNRRKHLDLTSPYVKIGMDRRSGNNRRSRLDSDGDLSKMFSVKSNVYKKQIERLL